MSRFASRLFALLLLVGLSPLGPQLFAQYWHPLPGNRALLFSYPDANGEAYLGLQAVHIQVEALDTAYYLYRIDRPVVSQDPELSCTNSLLSSVGFGILVNRDHYLGNKMLMRTNGDCLFVGTAGDSLLLRTQAAVGETWIWSPGISATVTTLQSGTVLGLVDSLKTIDLSNGKQIVLSQHYGLVHAFNFLPYGGQVNLDLSIWGIPDLSLGGHLPKWQEVIQLDPQDRYEIYETMSYMTSENTYTRVEILQPIQNTSINYASIKERLHVVLHPGAQNDSTYYAPLAGTTYYSISPSPLFELLPLQTNPAIDPNGNNEFYESARLFGTHQGRVQVDIGFAYTFDTCAWAIIPYSYYNYNAFTTGLGQTKYISYSSSTFRSGDMICYEKGAETWGTCVPLDSIVTGIAMPEIGFQCSPNPANEQLRVELAGDQSDRGHAVQMFAADGRLVLEHAMSPGMQAMTIQTAPLPAGVYQLRIEAEGSEPAFRRIVVAH